MSRGIFITFEGNEGCGKSTQIRALYRWLRKRGRSVLLTREPGGTRVGDAIRKVLLDRRQIHLNAVSETLLYMASRAQLTHEVILPAIKRGRIVLCDRWIDATYAYQGFGGGVDRRWIRRIGEFATAGLRPDRTIWLDLALETGLRRAASRGPKDRIESKTLAYHRKVRSGYLHLWRTEARRFRRVSVAERDGVSIVGRRVLEELADVL